MTTTLIIDGRAGQGELFGAVVASAGDVNGDGFADLLVGAPKSNTGSPGRLYLFFGSASGLDPASPQIIEGPLGGGAFGLSAGSAGDVNGDGYGDVVVGAPHATVANATFTGRAFVFYGSAFGLKTGANDYVTIDGADGADGQFGFSATGAGDVNGDGFADIIVSASGARVGGMAGVGKVYVFKGGAAGLDTAPFKVWAGPDGGGFGTVATGAGDINGDGIADVLITAPSMPVGASINVGRAYLYLGSATGFVTSPAILDSPFGAEARFGHGASSAGDIDRDGFADIVIGAPQAQIGPDRNVGAISIFRGSSVGLNITPANINGVNKPGFFGWSVSGGGDTTGDGFADVVVGSIAANSFAGRAFVYEGAMTGLTTTFTRSWDGPDTSGEFGTSVY
jgi:hypothetical protein